MKKSIFSLITLSLLIAISSCKPDDPPTLGDPPTDADAQFTYEATDTSDNVIVFTANNSSITAKWDFGNGTTAEGSSVVGTYPNKGTYTVTLTVFNSGGSNSSSQDIVIAEDDLGLLDDPLFNFLTGGTAGSGSKTWVLDSTREGHFGVGPNPSSALGDIPEYYAAAKGDKSETGLYDDQFVFTLTGFKYDQITNGSVYVNTQQEANFPGAFLNKGDYTAPFSDQLGESWTITKGEEDTTITVTGESFIGYYAGTRTYKIVHLSENELRLRYVDGADPALAWYLRLVPEDFPIDTTGGGGGGGGGNDSTAYDLPIDFETIDPVFEVFGNSTYSIIDNSQKTGINTSDRVLETVHGDQTWAGLFVDLKNPLDFSGADSTISVKVYAPTTGVMRVKIENSADNNVFIEKDVMVNAANQWVEVSIGFSTAATGTYDRLVLFPGWDVANAGTFLLDDIEQK